MLGFSAVAQSWQNFYLLVGEAAATLVGLMFVAVTFGSSLVTEETSPTVRSFLDPTFTHFVQILFTACLLTIPSMGPTVLGALLLVLAVGRLVALIRIFRHMREAHRKNNDLELSDWLSGVVFPLLCHLLLASGGLAFIAGYAVAFTLLAVVTVGILLNGVFGAWELMVWMAIARAQRK